MLYDVVGPVIVGPSSSHTAGMAKIGRAFYSIFNGKIEKVIFYLNEPLYSSFKGHGSDRALLGGILGLKESDEMIKKSIELAINSGIEYSFISKSFFGKHPNTVRIYGENQKKSLTLEGSSIGGGAIIINQIENQNVNLTGTYPALIIKNKDVPGALVSILSILRSGNVNISNLSLIRSDRINKIAICVIELDAKPLSNIIERIKDLTVVFEVSFMKELEVDLWDSTTLFVK